MDENKNLIPETDEKEDIADEMLAVEEAEAVSEEELQEGSDEEEAEDAEETEKEEPKKRKKVKKGPIIAAVAAVLLIALVAVVCMLPSSSSSPEDLLVKAAECIEIGEYAKVVDYTSATMFYPADKQTDITETEKKALVRNLVCFGFAEKVEAGSGLAVEIAGVEDLPQEEVDRMREIYTPKETDSENAEPIDITAVKKVSFSWVIEKTGEKIEDSAMLVKENGEWMIRW